MFTTGALPTKLGGLFPVIHREDSGHRNDSNPFLLWGIHEDNRSGGHGLERSISCGITRTANSATLVTRPVTGGTLLTIQNGTSWDSTNPTQQLIREIDLSGNMVHETNTGVIANQLVAMGATDATPCGKVPQPPPVGAGCLDDFHHDVIRVAQWQYTAFLAHIEKLYPGRHPGQKQHRLTFSAKWRS